MSYEPELGQALFGAPTGEYAVSEIGEGAIRHALREMERIHWNTRQERQEFGLNDGLSDYVLGDIRYNSYDWGEGEDAEKPNLAYDGVEIRWYKYFARGLSCNRRMTPNDWSDWLNNIMDHLRSLDVTL